jgi:hypothetical protein
MKLKLTNRQIDELAGCISTLEPAEGISPYKFRGKVRFALAESLRHLKTRLNGVEELRVKMLKEKLNGSGKLSESQLAEFQTEFLDVLNQEVEVEVHQIQEADIDLDHNQIPIQKLAPLLGTLIAD